jgi:hypothetical protein
MTVSVSPSLGLSELIRVLRGSVGGWAVRGWVSAALVVLLYGRLGVVMGRMERMVARFRAGRLWRCAVRDGRAVGRAGRVSVERIWPRPFGWLVRAAGWEAAGFGAQLRAVLAEPEMVALLAAAPQAARVLRPLCRMLAVEVSVLRQAPTVPAEGPGLAIGVKRVRAPRAWPDLGRVPIPRGVMAAVRRRGFADG